MKQGKVWGTTQEAMNNGRVSAHLLRVEAGGYCSEHRHAEKTNLFLVISGSLEILVWPAGADEGQKPDMTILGPGETTVIRPGDWHRFRALEDAVAIEIYEGNLAGEDITRRTPGGRS